MTAGPWDPMGSGAVGRSRLRASDADRDLVVDTLKAAFVQGRLTQDELGTRAGQALASRTYGELAALTADITTRLIETQPLPTAVQVPARTRVPAPAQARIDKRTVAWAIFMILMPVTLGAAFITYYVGFLFMFVFAFVGVAVTAQPDH